MPPPGSKSTEKPKGDKAKPKGHDLLPVDGTGASGPRVFDWLKQKFSK